MKKKRILCKESGKNVHPARVIAAVGYLPILVTALYILFTIPEKGVLTPAAAAYYGGMLEYPLAALAVLCGGALLAEAAVRRRAR